MKVITNTGGNRQMIERISRKINNFYNKLWLKTVTTAEQAWLDSPAGTTPVQPFFIAKALLIRAAAPVLTWFFLFTTCLAAFGFAIITLIVELSK